MTPAEQYRAPAAKLDAKARAELDPQIRAEWTHLAMNYLRLAKQAERNQAADAAHQSLLRGWSEDTGDTA
jgi:hypothetical protein